MKRIISAVLAAAALISLTVGCGTGDGNTDGERVELKVWGSQDDMQLLRTMCDEFAAANTDKEYTFSFGVVGESDAKKVFLDDPDAAADVFSFANDQLVDLVSAGALAQIGGSYKDTVESENVAGSVEAATVDGKLYAFPMTADNGYFLYYNKAVFATPPDTLNEILDACADGQKFAMKLSDSWYLASFFLTAGCGFADDKTVNFNSSAGLAAARAMNELCKDPRYINFGADYDSSVVSGFGDGSVIAAVSGTWIAEKIANEIGIENLGATKLPKITIDGSERQMIGFAGYKLVGVNAASEHPADAIKLAAWLTNEENQLKRFEERRMGPSNINAAENDTVKSDVALAALAMQNEYSVSQNNVPSSYWTAAEGFGTDLVSGNVSDDRLQSMLATLSESINNPIS